MQIIYKAFDAIIERKNVLHLRSKQYSRYLFLPTYYPAGVNHRDMDIR
jgi:hypothetical protein